MVRTYKRKTSRGRIDSSLYEKASRDVDEGRLSIRRAASVNNVNFMTLYRYIKRKEVLINKGLSVDKILGYSRHRQVFSDEIEEKLEDFIIQSCESIYQLTSKEMRSLAYIYAGLINIKYPEGWDRNKEASDDWLQSFLSRRPKLSFRKGKRPGYGVKYDKPFVRRFFDDFTALLKLHQFDGRQIWAVDEITVTVGPPENQGRGPTVRLLIAANSVGQTIPPQFIFPLPLFKPHFISQGPSGSIGAASLTSSVNSQIFLEFIQHLHEHARSSVDNPVLVIFNTDNPLPSTVWDFCKAKGIHLLPCPPTPPCLRPLEITAFTAFTKHYNSAGSSWMASNPDLLVTVYDVPMIVAEALPCAMTVKNITVGFQAAGIWPFDRTSVDKQYELTSTTISSGTKSQAKDTLSVIQPSWRGISIKQEPEEEEETYYVESPPSASGVEMMNEVKTESDFTNVF